jgi:hypothetical protein
MANADIARHLPGNIAGTYRGVSMELRCLLSLSVLALGMSGCGGTRLVKDAPPVPQPARPLAAATDASLGARLDGVLLRNGPGAWASNADWDEYLMQVDNHGAGPISVTRIAVRDSLGTLLTPESDRGRLVKASRQTVRRYKESGIEVQAGRGGNRLLASGDTSSGAAALGVALGLIVGGPIVAAIRITRVVRNGEVANRIEQRHTPLPLAVAPGRAAALNVFFPIAPSPQRLEITYSDANGEHRLALDTRHALEGLHLDRSSTATDAALETAAAATTP